MKRILAFILVALLCVAFSVSAMAAKYTVDENGNAVYDTAVGYTFKISSVNGRISGEDSTILTTASGLDNCGIWAIWFVAEQHSGNVYRAKTDGAAMGGTKPSVKLKSNQIIVVIHSASSNPNEASTYPNWEDKVAAIAVKTGDYLWLKNIDLATGTCNNGELAVITKSQANKIESSEASVDESSEPEEGSEEIESSEPEESSEEAESSEIDESSEAVESSEPVASSEAAESSEESDPDVKDSTITRGGSDNWIWIVIGVVVVVIAVAAVVVVLKKKKQ